MKVNALQKSPMTRRDFVQKTLKGAAMLVLVPKTELFVYGSTKDESWSEIAKEVRLHMIGHAHIDPVFRWPCQEGISIVHSTFRSALDRMNENPGFTLIASSALLYQWVAENDPDMLEEIKMRVLEGRWNIVGGWWVEPDVNMPSGESLIRQGLYGQLTFQRLLGCRAKIGFNPDSFGHANTLSQIFKLQGLEGYVFKRPEPNEKSLPTELFWWEGIDGTRILTYRIPFDYAIYDTSVLPRVKQTLKSLKDQPMKSLMVFYGVGDHGGGPTKDQIHSIEELKKEKECPKVLYSTLDRYFNEVKESALNLPIVKDELQMHAVGCYTAESAIKKCNRLSETALMVAEKIAAVGSVSWGAKYPKEKLTSAWQKLLFLQFHDILPGSALQSHSEFARKGFGYVSDIADDNTNLILQKLEWQVPAEDPDSEYLIVFNPHEWEHIGAIEYDFNWDIVKKPTRLEDDLGNVLIHQWLPATSVDKNLNRILAYVTIPPLGYRQLRLRKGDSPIVAEGCKVVENSMENEYLRINISKDGTIGIFDKETGDELFSEGQSGCRAVVIDDPSDTWSHKVKSYTNEIGQFENATTKILENGPLRVKVRVKTTYGDSYLTIDWSITKGSRKVGADITLDWHEHRKILKFSFPINIISPIVTCETPYGHIVREPNGNETPGQRWVDLNGKQNDKDYGLSIINDAKYGYSFHENDMRVSVARASVYSYYDAKVKLDLNKEYYWMDQGIQTFRMLLVPHKGNWIENNIVRSAEEFLAPLLLVYQGIHPGKMKKSGSLLSVDQPNVIIPSIKLAENSDDIIIRCLEVHGQQTLAKLELSFIGKVWTGKFRPYEIKTLRINRNTWKIKEVSLLEED